MFKRNLSKYKFDSIFQTFKLLCPKIEYAEEPIDTFLCFPGHSFDAQLINLVDWLAFTGVQVTTLPSDFYLGSALSFLMTTWNKRMRYEQRAMHRELARRLVAAGADLHYRSCPLLTLLQTLVAHTPMHIAHIEPISEWLNLLVSCGIDIEDYMLHESHFSHLKPFVIDLVFNFEAIVPLKDRMMADPYRCIDTWTIRIEPDNTGHLNIQTGRWVNPESSVTLLLEEFQLWASSIIIPGADCNQNRHLPPSWEDSPQDLRDVPVGALHMLDNMAWDFKKPQNGISILRADRDNIWILNQSSTRFSEGFLQNLAMNPEILISASPRQTTHRCSERLQSISYTGGMPPAEDAKSAETFKLSFKSYSQNQKFCHCDAFGNYLDLWPFHGSTHTLCQTGNKLHQPCLGYGDPEKHSESWCQTHKCKFNHARFERKQAQKHAKRCKCEGKKFAQFPMPGAWPT